MRSFIVMGMLISSLAMAEYKGYTEARTLELATDDISVFELDTGAGSLVIKGVEDANMIRVNAVVRIDEDDQDKARKVIESDMTLALVESRSRAKLTADFDSGFWRGNEDRAIDLEIEVPQDWN